MLELGAPMKQSMVQNARKFLKDITYIKDLMNYPFETDKTGQIRKNIETEVAPIVGSEEQANDLIAYIKDSQNTEEGVWSTNIFGKSIGELMEDGMKWKKISMMDDESQLKLQDTMQKIVNDSNGGLVCIII